MNRFRIHFLEFGVWMSMVLYASDDQRAREDFRRERPGAVLLDLNLEQR
jgi:hypothetical protein